MKRDVKETEMILTETKNALHNLMKKDDALNQLEVIEASQKLDEILNAYNQEIREKENNQGW